MKKTRFLALALVVALALSGAGYAFWTETLKVDTTVTTGMLDFEFQNASVEPVSRGMDYDGDSYGKAVNPWNDDSTLNVKLYNMYPGSEAIVNFEIKNAGTMDGRVEGFSLADGYSEDYLDEILVTSLKLDGVEQIPGPFSILDLSENIGGLSVAIDRDDAREFSMTLFVKKCADEERFAENLGRGFTGLDEISFAINAIGKQYNDDGSCDGDGGEEDPVDPGDDDAEYVFTDLRFDVTEAEYDYDLYHGYKTKKRYNVTGNLVKIYSNGEDTKEIEIEKQFTVYEKQQNGQTSQTFKVTEDNLTKTVTISYSSLVPR
ncbi:MAG: hypothetical protein GX231_09520 [Tissierellia bacterium]|nr:hypothetical protein [Tissierellia bacterium]